MTNVPMSPLAKDDPRMLAWEAYKATEDFANSLYWATTDTMMRQGTAAEHGIDTRANVATSEMKAERAQGSLWAAFIAGWTARGEQP